MVGCGGSGGVRGRLQCVHLHHGARVAVASRPTNRTVQGMGCQLQAAGGCLHWEFKRRFNIKKLVTKAMPKCFLTNFFQDFTFKTTNNILQ